MNGFHECKECGSSNVLYTMEIQEFVERDILTEQVHRRAGRKAEKCECMKCGNSWWIVSPKRVVNNEVLIQ